MRRAPEMGGSGAGKTGAEKAEGLGLGSGPKTPFIYAAADWPALWAAGDGGGKVGDSG